MKNKSLNSLSLNKKQITRLNNINLIMGGDLGSVTEPPTKGSREKPNKSSDLCKPKTDLTLATGSENPNDRGA